MEAVVEDGKIVVSVRDTGLGIPADEQEAIFDESVSLREPRRGATADWDWGWQSVNVW
jgi:Histidine kinase-, DNA gyrase B-, and HSP90-like ATPase.